MSRLKPIILNILSGDEFKPFENNINPALSDPVRSTANPSFAFLSSSLSSCRRPAASRGHHQKNKACETGYLNTSTCRGRRNRKSIITIPVLHADQTRYVESTINCIPDSPPAHNLRAPNAQARQLFQHFHPKEPLTGGQRRLCEYKHRQAR
jgi:hypothetical protein